MEKEKLLKKIKFPEGESLTKAILAIVFLALVIRAAVALSRIVSMF